MAKYKPGDRVIVRDDIVADDGVSYYMQDDPLQHNSFVFGMDKFRGKVVTIDGISNGQYTIEEMGFRWTDEMFAGLESEIFSSVPSVDDLL